MPRHLQRKASDTSCNDSEKGTGHGSIFYAKAKPYVNPCDTHNYVFDPKDAGDIRSQKKKDIYLKNATRAQNIKKVAQAIKERLFGNHFKGVKMEDFDSDTQLYRFEFLPPSPPQNADHMKPFAKKIINALIEVYKPLVYFTVVLKWIRLENIVFPEAYSKMILDLELHQMKAVCDLQLGFFMIGPQKPDDEKAQEIIEFEMSTCGSRLARGLRQYFILRDYVKLVSYLEFMWRFCAENTS